MKNSNLPELLAPELLAPAGSRAALEAAVDAGADAVYFGGSSFNARAGAQNFSNEEIRDAIAFCRAYGVKAYITLNILFFDRELPQVLSYAEFLYKSGADALITADLGLASLIKKHIPGFQLHASTQMSAHNSEAGHMLKSLGFSRMVCARELPYDNIKNLVRNSPIETEMFIHGAMCVSHSGQCLASSLIGQRSGNRGECAQPCRLPWNAGTARNAEYPLSLRDLCLAGHMREILQSGVSSLKIEGRMKPPEYVHNVVSVYRRLIDERRNANADETELLARVFSRNGFTDRYFISKPDKTMLGIRTENDKQNSRGIPPFEGLRRKIPIKLEVEICSGKPAQLCAAANGRQVRVFGDIAETAINVPLSKETVIRNISKLGQTPYTADENSIIVTLEGSPMMRISALNALRRAAVEELQKPDSDRENFLIKGFTEKSIAHEYTQIGGANQKTARFTFVAQIPPQAKDYFDIIYLPLEEYMASYGGEYGIILPPVIFDSELHKIDRMLAAAKEKGAVHALVGNIGHIEAARRHGFECHGDFRLNITNSVSAKIALETGLADIMVSPELTLPQIRDIKLPKSTIIYGRIPLMLLEKCVIRDTASCEVCNSGKAELCDRRGIKFPLVREQEHRNVLLNSVPVYMADKAEQLNKYNAGGHHFLFTVETMQECLGIMYAYDNRLSPDKPVRRIQI